MDERTTRAVAAWGVRVALACALAWGLQLWQGPDPFLWWLAAGYAVLSLVTTLVLLRRRPKDQKTTAEKDRE